MTKTLSLLVFVIVTAAHLCSGVAPPRRIEYKAQAIQIDSSGRTLCMLDMATGKTICIFVP